MHMLEYQHRQALRRRKYGIHYSFIYSYRFIVRLFSSKICGYLLGYEFIDNFI